MRSISDIERALFACSDLFARKTKHLKDFVYISCTLDCIVQNATLESGKVRVCPDLSKRGREIIGKQVTGTVRHCDKQKHIPCVSFIATLKHCLVGADFERETAES